MEYEESRTWEKLCEKTYVVLGGVTIHESIVFNRECCSRENDSWSGIDKNNGAATIP
jgi:hypothetical protein